jgi:type IV pilus assembly protein PilY1
VAVLKDASGNLQPVTAAPELLSYAGKRIVLVGTGRLLDITDFGSTACRPSTPSPTAPR